jgi:hypothetical protein
MSKTFRPRKATSRIINERDNPAVPHSTFSVDLQEEFKLSSLDDVQYQEIRLYIEGVQVPFDTITVSCPYLDKPTATVSVPPASGITEIARNYFPKVHIFFRDMAHERFLLTKEIPYDEEEVFKLLFSGVIHRSTYGKTNSSGGANAYVQFHCTHRDYIVDEASIKFGGRGMETLGGRAGEGQLDTVVGQSQYFSSGQAALKALEGLKIYDDRVQDKVSQKIDIDTFISRYNSGTKYTEKDIEIVDPAILGAFLGVRKFDDLKGVPSILLIMWQILKMDAYKIDPSFVSAMRRGYIPAIDDGLEYFRRLKGHSIIEESINSEKYKVDSDLLEEANTKTSPSAGPVDTSEIIMPPVFRTFLGKALSTDLATRVIQSIQSGMSERMTIEMMFNQIIQLLRYDKIYLASPVQALGFTKSNVGGEDVNSGLPDADIDKIVKPLLPFYYSPVCNVFLPNMYDSLSVSESYYDSPTRVVTINQGSIIGQAEALGGIEYRAPHGVRKAWAYAATQSTATPTEVKGGRQTSKPNLNDSLPHRGEVISAHELGQGIRTKLLPTPEWVMYLNMSYENVEQRGDIPGKESLEGREASDLEKIISSWNRKYPTDPVSFNPWEENKVNGLMGYQRNIINTLDYDYALSMVDTRAGQLSGPFNPFVIPGYPCDVLDPSPDRPSFHGFVVSVNHSISSGGSIVTSVSFSSAMSYDEMQSYDSPPVFPWIRVQLGLAEKSNLINQPEETKAIASNYYRDVLGVGFADPSYLYDFDTGTARKVLLNTYSGDLAQRTKGDSTVISGRTTTSFFDTVEGNLMMCRREIESMSDIESLGLTKKLKFIHIEEGRIEDPSASISSDKSNLTEEEQKNVEEYYDKVADVGKSTFLTYPTPAEEVSLATRVPFHLRETATKATVGNPLSYLVRETKRLVNIGFSRLF